MYSKLSIIHETTSPYTPEHNRIADQYNRTLQEGVLLYHIDYPKNTVTQKTVSMFPDLNRIAL